MSRIGKKPINIPAEAQVELKPGKISVSGPRGSLDFKLHLDIAVEKTENELLVSKKKETKQANALWGTTARIISNMIKGVTEGFEKKLELNGVGYRMAVAGKKINLALGFSHPVEKTIPNDLEVKVEGNVMIISGNDKQKVGQLAAEIRALKPVEPYKGKGFRYVGEIVRKKEGKKAVASG